MFADVSYQVTESEYLTKKAGSHGTLCQTMLLGEVSEGGGLTLGVR